MSGNAVSIEAQRHPLAAGLHWQNAQFREPTTSMGALDAGWLRVDGLTSPGSAMLSELLDYQTRFQKGVDARTQGAYLIASYSHLLSIAIVAPFLKASVLPDFSPNAVALFFEDRPTEFEGRTVIEKRPHLRFLSDRFWTCEQVMAQQPGACNLPSRAKVLANFRQMIEGHFRPLIACVRERTKLPAAAQWRLVGDAVSAVCLDVGERLGQAESAKADALTILKAEGSPLANPQLHFFDLSIPLGEGSDAPSVTRTFRSRGGCCRFYKTEGGHLCTTCVLEKPEERDRRLREAMTKRLAQSKAARERSA